MGSIFNSLGSNYEAGFAYGTLFARGGEESKLVRLLEKTYQGQAVLTYKGREAIELGLKSLNLPEGSFVAINGFTCYAVYKAVANAGLRVAYLDIVPPSLHFSPATLAAAVAKNPKIKAVIIQNTLGYPAEVPEIASFCRSHGLFLMEDLAHSIGAQYTDGILAGTVGDLTILSFSQDKVIDGVSGGALIVRNKKIILVSPEFVPLSQRQQLIDRWYPLFTLKIRATYAIGLGKLLHKTLKTMNFLPRPVGDQKAGLIHALPGWYSGRALLQFERLEKNLRHRQEVAEVYTSHLDPRLVPDYLKKDLAVASALRFPILVKNRASLINRLKKEGVYISDTWYDAPIAPPRFMKLTDYDGECPEAERAANEIVNLPTHAHVSKESAFRIAKAVNHWLTTQP